MAEPDGTRRHQSALVASGLALGLALLSAHYLFAKSPLAAVPLDVALLRARDLLVFALFVASAWVAGERGLARLGATIPESPHRAALAVGLGFVPFSAVATLLTVAGMLRPWVLGVVIALPLLLWRDEARRLAARCRALLGADCRPSAPLIVGAALAGFYALVAVAPPTDVDSLTYHLTLPRDYLAHGGLPHSTGNFFHNFPNGSAFLYVYLIGLGSDLLPKLLNGLFLALLAVLVHGHLAARAGRWVAGWSTLLFAGQWSVHHGIQRANVDFHFAFYGLAAFLVLAQVRDPVPGLGRVARWPPLVGLLLGAALAGKVHAVPCVVAAFVLLLVLRWERLAAWGQIAAVAGAIAVVYAPILLRNLAVSTDPLLFLAADRLGLALPAPPEVADRLRALGEVKDLFMTRPGLVNLLLVPVFLYRDGDFPTTTFDAKIDPLYLLGLPLAAWALRGRFAATVWIYLGAFYLAWMATTPLTRYAMPVLPLVAYLTVAGVGAAAERVAPRAGVALRRTLGACIVAVTVANAVGSAAVLRLSEGLAATVGLVERERFLERREGGPDAAVARFLDAEERRLGLPRGGLYMVLGSQVYFLGDRPYVNDPFYVNLGLLERVAADGRDPLAELRRQGFRWVLFEESRIPWLLGGRHGNPRLNPYPEGRARLRRSLRFWKGALEPRLEPVARFPGRFLFRIPEPPPPGAAAPVAPQQRPPAR